MMSPDRGQRPRSPISGLLAMIGTRGLDQIALGGASLLIARRTGTEDFAPFATVFILYALSAQVGDGGLAFAVLRSPSTARLDSRARMRRLTVGLVLAGLCAAIGVAIGGSSGVVVAFAGVSFVTAPAVFVGRAALQWSDEKGRLALGEGAGAVAFLAATVALVHTAEDLPLFVLICIGKHAIELAVQGLSHAVFATGGSTVRSSGIFVSQAVTYVAANVDYLLVGMLLGAEALSVYAIGFGLASAFSSIVVAPLTRTAFVDFANTSDESGEHDRLLRKIAVFGLIGVITTMVAASVLPVVLGPGWEDTRRVTAVLGLALPWRLLLGPVVALGLTMGSARRVILWEIVRTAALAAAIVAGSASLDRVAGAVSSATILTVGWAYRRAAVTAGIRPSKRLTTAGFVVAALAMAFVAV